MDQATYHLTNRSESSETETTSRTSQSTVPLQTVSTNLETLSKSISIYHTDTATKDYRCMLISTWTSKTTKMFLILPLSLLLRPQTPNPTSSLPFPPRLQFHKTLSTSILRSIMESTTTGHRWLFRFWFNQKPFRLSFGLTVLHQSWTEQSRHSTSTPTMERLITSLTARPSNSQQMQHRSTSWRTPLTSRAAS